MKEAILLTDGYKLDHRRQYPEGTGYVCSNWTPGSCHYYPEAKEGAVVFGIQYFIKESSFCGSETIPAIAGLGEYYNADAGKGLIAAAIPATGHSVMCAVNNSIVLED